MNKVIFSKIGMGVTFDSIEDMNENILPVSVKLASGEVVPGKKTDLGGFWAHPIEYKGLLKGEDNEMMVFYLGESQDLFEQTIYCDVVARIDENVLFKKYTERSGRDFKWIKNQWR